MQLGAAHAEDPSLQQQVLAAGRRAVDARLLGHVADRAPRPVRVPHDVVPGDERVAGVGARQVVRTRTVVDLPAPFGPSRPKTSLSRTAKSTPSSACTSPYRLWRPRTSIASMRLR